MSSGHGPLDNLGMPTSPACCMQTSVTAPYYNPEAALFRNSASSRFLSPGGGRVTLLECGQKSIVRWRTVGRTFHSVSATTAWPGPSAAMGTVGIIGAGSVGSSIASALVQSGIPQQVVLVDVRQERCRGEALDLADGPTRSTWRLLRAECACLQVRS